jgi:Rieske Fe-S protein
MIEDGTKSIIVERLNGENSPTCTHLGCKLNFNELEKTWDCPCHGSRYTEKGSVLESPAVSDLKQ